MVTSQRKTAAYSTWGAVRLQESRLAHGLRSRYWLWLHGWFIGLVIVLVMWGTAHLQLVMGSQSLALRYLLTLGVGYLAYLLMLRVWGAALARREPVDGLNAGGDLPLPRQGGVEARPQFESGTGGDYGGGGASADFSEAAGSSNSLGDVAGGALEAVGAADEGIVIVPVIAVFLAGLAALFGFGSLLLLYFGSEVLLAVAVELAFGYVGARTAMAVEREGWLSAAVRVTWKPLLGALVCAVVLGGVLDYFVPEARSLPHAVQLMRAR